MNAAIKTKGKHSQRGFEDVAGAARGFKDVAGAARGFEDVAGAAM